MNKIHILDCPVCSGSEIQLFLNCKDWLVTNETFRIDKCCTCGFAFTQDYPPEKDILKYYQAENYISHTDINKGLINKIYHWARKIALNRKIRLVQKYAPKKPKTLLDIGCGTGHFIRAIRDKKWIVTGIEKAQNVREYAHDKFGLNIQSSEYLLNIPEQTKSVITMWHVLEHIEKLDEVMSTLHKILKNDGTIFIALPNKDSSDASYYKQNWAAYDVPRHLWHFSPSNFKLLANKHGFKVCATKRMNFDPFYISILSERIKRARFSSLLGLIKGFVFWLDSLFNKKHSSSIIYILQKQK